MIVGSVKITSVPGSEWFVVADVFIHKFFLLKSKVCGMTFFLL